MRSLGKEMREFLKKRVTEISENIAASYGAKAEVKIIESYPGIVNHNSAVDFVKNCAVDLYGSDKVKIIETPGMVSEDFGYYLDEAEGCFYHVGCDSENVLHSDSFKPDEKALITMMEMHVKTVLEFLK